MVDSSHASRVAARALARERAVQSEPPPTIFQSRTAKAANSATTIAANKKAAQDKLAANMALNDAAALTLASSVAPSSSPTASLSLLADVAPGDFDFNNAKPGPPSDPSNVTPSLILDQIHDLLGTVAPAPLLSPLSAPRGGIGSSVVVSSVVGASGLAVVPGLSGEVVVISC